MPANSYPLLKMDYPHVLFNEPPASRKGERTKQSLIWACATLLNQTGYQELRVSDICELAEVSNAAFYIYFKNKIDITQTTLEGFSTAIFEALLLGTPYEQDNQEALYKSNLVWLKIARANAGLMRCILQVSFVNPSFAQYYDTINSNYMIKIARNIAKRANLAENKAQMLVLALSSMTDEFTRRLLSEVDSPLDAVIKKECASDAELAEFLSELWFKAIYV